MVVLHCFFLYVSSSVDTLLIVPTRASDLANKPYLRSPFVFMFSVEQVHAWCFA
jgi:hypothetical protein